MGMFIFLTVFLVLSLAVSKHFAEFGKSLPTVVRVVSILLYAVFALVSSVRVVDAGEQAVITRFGKVQGETLGSGLHLVVPFVDSVKIFSVREEKIEADAAAASKDLQTVSAKVAVNLRLDPSKINELYRTVGVNWQDKIVDPAIQETVKASTAQFTAEELITRRPEVAKTISETLSARLKDSNIIVQTVSITNFDFSKSFNEAIEAKQVAQQNVAKANQDLERVKVEAAQKVAQAEAEASSLRAQKQEITPELIELRKVEAQQKAIDKWNGVLPTTSTGDSIPFINITK